MSEQHLWLGTVLSDGDPLHQRAFPDRQSAMRWVEHRLQTPATWSGGTDADASVIVGVEETEYDEPPGVVRKIPLSSPERVIKYLQRL